MGIKDDKVARMALERLELDARVWGALVKVCRDRECCPVRLLMGAESEGIEKARSVAIRLINASKLEDNQGAVMDSMWRFLSTFRNQAGRLSAPSQRPSLKQLRGAADTAALIVDPDSRTLPLDAVDDPTLMIRLVYHMKQLYPSYAFNQDDVVAAVLSERWMYEQYANPIPDSVGPWGSGAEGSPPL